MPLQRGVHPWTFQKDYFEKLARKTEATAKLLVKEDSWLMKTTAWILFLVSFGKITRERFLEHAATTIGNRIYLPKYLSCWSANHIIPHEAQHASQFRKAALGMHPILGIPGMAIAYTFPLPVGLAWGRMKLELDADIFEWKHLLKTYAEEELSYIPWLKVVYKDRAQSVSGSLYLWSWPYKWTLAAYKSATEKIIQEWEGR